MQENKDVVWYCNNVIQEKRNKRREVIEDGNFHISKLPDFAPEKEKELANVNSWLDIQVRPPSCLSTRWNKQNQHPLSKDKHHHG
jgi:hypothetical protein